jgi:hypothetical protein
MVFMMVVLLFQSNVKRAVTNVASPHDRISLCRDWELTMPEKRSLESTLNFY